VSNLKIYEAVRTVPANALKEIQAGRLKGKSDINPMWRLKTLTEQFGPCGIGWKYVITKQWLEQGAGGEIGAFVNIELYIKYNDQWSEAIPGTGGSMFVASERNGLYTSDECYKMALTDAISVSCKALGFGADVYWNADKTKYDGKSGGTPKTNPQKQDKPLIGQEVPFTPDDLPPGFTDAPVCADCKAKITQAEIGWCKGKPKYQGKSLCKVCQKKYK
jgi:hypothetical protein